MFQISLISQSDSSNRPRQKKRGSGGGGSRTKKRSIKQQTSPSPMPKLSTAPDKATHHNPYQERSPPLQHQHQQTSPTTATVTRRNAELLELSNIPGFTDSPSPPHPRGIIIDDSSPGSPPDSPPHSFLASADAVGAVAAAVTVVDSEHSSSSSSCDLSAGLSQRGQMGQKVSGGIKMTRESQSNNGGSSTAVSGSASSASSSAIKSLQNRSRDDYNADNQKPARLDILLDSPVTLSKEQQTEQSWNPEDRSLNIFVKEDDKSTFHRHPVAQSTDCIRGKKGYTRGLHVWQIHWSTRQRGTHAVVGVATKDAPLHCVGYQSLVGNNDQSWGWDLGRNKLYHDLKNTPGKTYPSILSNDENFVVPDTFLVCLDMDEGTLSYVVDGQYLGVAFRGLKGKKLYPIVSAVWGHCEITMTYLGGLDRK